MMFLSGRSHVKTLDSSGGENFHCLVELDVWLWTMEALPPRFAVQRCFMLLRARCERLACPRMGRGVCRVVTDEWFLVEVS